MAITNLLAPMPKWIVINNQGTTAGGAKLYTKRSLNKVQDKATYQDAGGNIPSTNPIIFDANGTKGPIYWQVDSSNLNDTYYLEMFDSDDNLLWTVDDFSPPGSGGGGNVTTYIPLSNMIANNVFIEHIDDTVNPVGATNLLIAPSNHHGFTPDLINPVIGTNGALGPDIRFVKNNTAATDQITFPLFPLGSDPLTGDVTPVNYVRYQCTNSPAAETFKSFQYPICQKVNNLDNQDMTFTCWGRVGVTDATVTIYLRQYFGSGGSPSAEVRTSVGTMALTTTWTKFNITFAVPNTAGKTLGDCGDDGLYLQMDMPLGGPCDIWFTKPALYLGNIDADQDFDTYDEIDSIIQTPRTGDIKTSFRSAANKGWLNMNDRTIGSATSGATSRANQDTFFLFKTLWDGVNDVFAPVSGGRGVSAVADFSANKTLTLTRQLGRVLIGQNADYTSSLTFTADSATDVLTVSSTAQLPTGSPIMVINSGGGLPAPLNANTVYYVINASATTLQLARSVDLAQLSTAIDITTNGSGTNSIIPALGAFLGEGQHLLLEAELPAGQIGAQIAGSSGNFGGGAAAVGVGPPVGSGGVLTNSTIVFANGGTRFNDMQPSTVANVFIKL